MKVVINNTGETIFNIKTSSNKTVDNFSQTIISNFNEKSFKGWYTEYIFEKFKIGIGSIQTRKQFKVNFDLNGDSVEMLFNLQGKFSINVLNEKKKFYFTPNSHNINFYSNTEGYLEFDSTDSFIIRINLSPSFFIQYLPDYNNFKDFKKIINHKKYGQINPENKLIDSRMHFLIKEIINCDSDINFRKIHITSKILELLLLQLNQFKKTNKEKELIYLSSSEETKMLKAREYILNNYNTHLTLALLSKEIGTNEYALKKGFKTTFGTTVFNFIADIKMTKAKDLLLEGYTVHQVSEKIGYKNPQHFSTAFKKKFGLPPSKFITNLNSYK